MHSQALLPLLLGLTLGTPASAAEGGSAFSVAGGLTRAYQVEPGTTTEGQLMLQNDGDSPADIRLYQTDYHFEADGTTSYDDPGTLPRSNASWIELTPSQVTVPANGTASVFFAITVPSDLLATGTYWSVVMVEPLAVTAGPSPEGAGRGVQVGVRMIQRYAIQMVTTIGQGQPAVAFSNSTVANTETGPELTIDIANTGDLWLRPNTWAELFDAEGHSLGRYEGSAMRIFPGCAGRYRIPLTNVAAGEYRALVVADGGDAMVFGTEVPLTIP